MSVVPVFASSRVLRSALTVAFGLLSTAASAQPNEPSTPPADSSKAEPSAPNPTPAGEPATPPELRPRRPGASDPPAPPVPEAAPSAGLDLYLGPSLSLGSAPSLASGGRLGLQLRAGWFRGFVEARSDFFAKGKTVEERTLATSISGGGFGPCVAWSMLFACGVVTVGVLSASEGYPTGSGIGARVLDPQLHVAIGGRGGVEIDVVPRVALRAQLEGLATLTNRTFVLDPQNDVRELSSGAAVFGVHAVIRLF